MSASEIQCKMVAALREALNDDPEAINLLFSTRVPCNRKLADSPLVQVAETPSGFDVGALGIINALCEASTGKRICSVMDDQGRIIGFQGYETFKK